MNSAMDWLLGVLPILVIGGFVLLIGYAGVAVVANATTESACLLRGWTSGKVTWNLSRYCVTRTDQTDIVVPLSEAYQR